MANKLIPSNVRSGRILDIGCGSYPTFLTQTQFAERYGVDRVLNRSMIDRMQSAGICLETFDADQEDRLPFPDEFFAVVSMLAVYEHLLEDRLKVVLRDVSRVLRPGGIFVMTTPSHWTEPVLTLLSTIGFISSEEVDEHQRNHKHSDIRPYLEDAGFLGGKLRMGYFEARMNQWVVAEK